MTGDPRRDPRRHRSKWDTKEGPPDVFQISEDKSHQKMDIHWKGSDFLPKPEASMHRSSGGHDQEHQDGVNKDMKDIQFKASSERSQPSKLADEHDGKGWDEAGLEKPYGNRGINRYVDDIRGDDGWGSALDRSYPSRIPSDSDAWRQRSCSPSPRGVWNRSHRNRSRSRSRSRGRSRGRSPSPYFVGRGPEQRIERGRTPGEQNDFLQSSWRDEARQSAYEGFGPVSSYNKKPCKFFAASQCRSGANCLYLHEEAPQSQIGLRAPDEPSSYNDVPTRRGHFSNWGEPKKVTHETSQSASRYDRGNPVSLQAGNVAENLDQILHRQDAIPQIHGPATLPVTTLLQNNASSFPSNIHMQPSNFSVHPQGTQVAANNAAHNAQGQPVACMGHSQLGYGLEARALPNFSAHNGHNFSVAGQAPQHLSTSVHTGQSQATIYLHRLSRDSSAQAKSIQNMQGFQPVAPNVQIQKQSLHGSSLLPASSSAEVVGAHVSHNAAKGGDIQRVTASLAQYSGNAGTLGPQPSQPNMNLSLIVASSAAAPSAVQPNPWRPWAQKHPGMVQRALPVPPEQHQQAPEQHYVPPEQHQQAPEQHSGASTVQAAEEGEAKGSDAEANKDGGNKKSKDSKMLKIFKVALAEFAKDALKQTWKEGRLSRDAYKTIVKKVVDKVTSTVEKPPPTVEKIDLYLTASKDKLNTLVQAYVGRYAKA